MRRPLILRIVEGLGKWFDYFTTGVDALGQQGLTPLQKCIVAICQLANGGAADVSKDWRDNFNGGDEVFCGGCYSCIG